MEQSKNKFFFRRQPHDFRFESDLAHYSLQLSQLALKHSAYTYDSLCQEAPRQEPRGLLVPCRRYLHRRGVVLLLSFRVVRRPSDLDLNLLREHRHVVTFDAVLPSLKVRKVGMILSLVFLMNRTSMAGITLVVLVST